MWRLALFGVGYAAASLSCTFGVLLAVIAQAQATASYAGLLAVFAAYAAGAAALLLLVSIGTAAAGRDTHELAFTKVFRGAPDPSRDPSGALMEAKRAAQWEAWGCKVYRQTVNYKGDGTAEEKGVDVRLANSMLLDAVKGEMDTAVLISADKDFRYAILQVLDETDVDVEVAIWKAVPGGTAVGRIEIRPERPEADEIPFHPLDRSVFGRVEDKIDYRNMPTPAGWRGPVPDTQWRPGTNRR